MRNRPVASRSTKGGLVHPPAFVTDHCSVTRSARPGRFWAIRLGHGHIRTFGASWQPASKIAMGARQYEFPVVSRPRSFQNLTKITCNGSSLWITGFSS